jgi:ceramide glucosyltransferase
VTIAIACLLLLALSVAVCSAGAAALAALRRERRDVPSPGFFPPVSIVNPLSGVDDELESNLESFYRIDYPAYQVLYSFARRSDPAFSVARRVADRHPEITSVLVVDARETGGNPKVSRLSPALRHARFRHILMADGNVRVHPEFLSRAISFFANPSILVSREALNAIGGIEALRDHLAEDYLLGRLVARAGYRVVLSGDEIETAEVSRSLAAAWSRQRRWAILRKRLGGLSYATELLANPLPWLAGTLLAGRGEPRLGACAAALYLLRAGVEAFAVARPETLSAADWLLIPLRDAAVAGLFFTGLIGTRTCWRGRILRVGRDTLIEQPPAEAGRLAGAAHPAAERG